MMDEVQSTESAIVSSYPTSMSGIIVLLNTKHWIQMSQILVSTDTSFWPFCGKIFLDKIVSFHIWITRNSISSVWYLINYIFIIK